MSSAVAFYPSDFKPRFQFVGDVSPELATEVMKTFPDGGVFYMDSKDSVGFAVPYIPMFVTPPIA